MTRMLFRVHGQYCSDSIGGKIQKRLVHSMEQKEKQETMTKNRILTLPNVITLSRIVISPWISFFILNGQYQSALVLTFGLGVTDFV